jgi:diphthamide biosynthesis methyltransferase
MTADTAADLLADPLGAPLGVAVARAGSPDPAVVADSLPELAGRTFGDPLHMLVVPADLHRMEAEALDAFAGLPAAFAPEAERRR